MSTTPETVIAGIHHVTAIATDPQTNLDFYAGLLGMRLVKRTVNFDDPGTYHLYYGDETGRPGTILTFFPWPLARRGSRGAGQATAVALAVPEGSLGWWSRRLSAAGVVHQDPVERFDGEVLVALDPDGMRVELIADPAATTGAPWSGSPVPERHAVRSVHSVTLTVARPEPTAELLTAGLGLRPPTGNAGDGEGGRLRFESPSDTGVGTRVDLVEARDPAPGRIAAGSIHHVAWRAADDDDQLAWRRRLIERGLHPTEVLDRSYFHSIYFREPGGVLFEIATDGPGFATDEPVAELGEELRLPPWLAPRRPEIAERLPELAAPSPFAGEAAAGEADDEETIDEETTATEPTR